MWYSLYSVVAVFVKCNYFTRSLCWCWDYQKKKAICGGYTQYPDLKYDDAKMVYSVAINVSSAATNITVKGTLKVYNIN